MRIKLTLLSGLILLILSCTKDELLKDNYFVFGSAYGECTGDCATFFLMENDKIYPDNMSSYYNSTLTFKNDPLPQSKYDLSEVLIDDFPKYLTDNPNQTFGCPDCHDQGGIHIQIMENGEIKSWHLDTEISSLPAEIQSYVQEIQGILQQLR
ncbi:MAG: hypothetical protein ACM3RX_04450 [Methanococcaceae archaeon]